MKAISFVTLVVVLAWTVVASGQDPPIDRFYGKMDLAFLTLETRGINGGVGGFKTTSSIKAQAVVKVQEGQNLTWEWLGITAPETFELEGFPNVSFTMNSADTFEYRDLEIDLNPIAPNVWGSGERIALPFGPLDFNGNYKSFSFETEFNATIPLGDFKFGATVATLNYTGFPNNLNAEILVQNFEPDRNFGGRVDGFGEGIRTFRLSPPVEIEPKLGIYQFEIDSGEPDLEFFRHELNGFGDVVHLELHHTPTGDANNDGKVGFDDFLILSGRFGAQAAAWEDGDFDFDGIVGFSDFLGLSTNFGTSSNAPVPEPSTSLLAAFGTLGLLGLRCRRP